MDQQGLTENIIIVFPLFTIPTLGFQLCFEFSLFSKLQQKRSTVECANDSKVPLNSAKGYLEFDYDFLLRNPINTHHGTYDESLPNTSHYHMLCHFLIPLIIALSKCCVFPPLFLSAMLIFF